MWLSVFGGLPSSLICMANSRARYSRVLIAWDLLCLGLGEEIGRKTSSLFLLAIKFVSVAFQMNYCRYAEAVFRQEGLRYTLLL